jgi:hypothetical protein
VLQVRLWGSPTPLPEPFGAVIQAQGGAGSLPMKDSMDTAYQELKRDSGNKMWEQACKLFWKVKMN